MTPTISVVVITYRRPGSLAACLQSLDDQVDDVFEVIVVDQSPDDLSGAVVAEHDRAIWVDNRRNAGRMTSSRNIGLDLARGDLIAFLDDDVVATPGWSQAVRRAFLARGDLGGVTGLTRNRGEARALTDAGIGIIQADGRVIGNFDMLGAEREVEHLIGANMTFRRKVLRGLGGLHEDYPGTAMGEDTDICLRVRAAGWRLAFLPSCEVDHRGAPHVVGRRFDHRYTYFAHRNYVQLHLRHSRRGGVGGARYAATALRAELCGQRRLSNRAVRTAVAAAGLIAGFVGCARRGELRGGPLVRQTPNQRPRMSAAVPR